MEKYEPRNLQREWVDEMMRSAAILFFSFAAATAIGNVAFGADGSRFAHTDSDARYLHHIDLYDADNRKITADSDQPYSSVKTCGRCHDYDSISHGWHFNAFQPATVDGREGEPWIWTDARTGTQLPLSYRDWAQTYDPREIGISTWQMTHQFGPRIPGGGLGIASEPSASPPASEQSDAADEGTDDNADADESSGRWEFSGSLDIDCMVCHAVSGQYDFNLRREQIENENFAWAATAALRLGSVDGDVSRIKDGSDPTDESVKAKFPKVVYDSSKFASDGTVFMDLVRHPESNACYQCHSNRTVSDSGIEPRWIHDEDVHLRAGMQCSDCHRNGIDHHIVRGFEGEESPAEHSIETLSCAGCHLGDHHDGHDEADTHDLMTRAGRLGSPKPLHAGLPPIHFEKLSCTACHAGPAPREEALRVMTSLAHGLGSKEHRTGFELPALAGPVFRKGGDERVYPQRAMWPAFWGVMENDEITPLPPEQVYDITRRALRVRKDFVEELLQPRLSSTDLKEVLGEDRAKTKEDEWTEEESAKVTEAQTKKGRELFEEKVDAALAAIEEQRGADDAVYVSSGYVYGRGEKEGTLKRMDAIKNQATEMVSWPIAHSVRPAGWSLGIAGCTECHSDDGLIFSSTLAAQGPGPDVGPPVTMAMLQGVDPDQRLAWNQLFAGRATFKYVIAASLALLTITLFIGLGAAGTRWTGNRETA